MLCHRHVTTPINKEVSKTCPATGHNNVDKSNEHQVPIIRIRKELLIENCEIKIKLNLSIAQRPITMIVDSGSMLTLLSSNVVHPETIYYPHRKVNLIGINGDKSSIQSMGLAFGSFRMADFELKQEFQIVNETVNLNSDGLLGFDFLRRYGAKLNLLDDIIELTLPPDHEAYEPKKIEIENNNTENLHENLIDFNNEVPSNTNIGLNETLEPTGDSSKEPGLGSDNINTERPGVGQDNFKNKELNELADSMPKEPGVGSDYTDIQRPGVGQISNKEEKFNESAGSTPKEPGIGSLFYFNTSNNEITTTKEPQPSTSTFGQTKENIQESFKKKAKVKNKDYYRTNLIESEESVVEENNIIMEKSSEETEISQINTNKNIEEIKIRRIVVNENQSLVHTIQTLNQEKENSYLLPANSIKIFGVRTNENKILICNGKEIKDNIHIMEGVVESKDGYAKIAVVNTNDAPISVNKQDINVDLEDINNYTAYPVKYDENKDPNFRINHLMKNLALDHCTEMQKRIMHDIIREFHDVFYIEGDRNTFTEASTHFIPLKPGTQPIFTPQYKIPQSQRDIVDEHINKLIEDDIVEPSTSRWNSPVLLVPKRENSKGEKQYRLVVDFRKLNEVTETQTFPMPDLEEETSKMNGAKIFSTLDLNAAFHQIPLAIHDRELTSFQTSNRKLQFKRMPFGLKGSPITWQRTINFILGDLLNKNNMAYMDDIISYNSTLEEHINNLKQVLTRLRRFNLKLKIEKSLFLRKEVQYLGHIINEHGTKVNPKKIECIQKFPRPATVVEVQSFLGMCNYYRKYVNNFSKIAKPLHNLCRKDIPIIWNEGYNQAFEQLKRALMTTPVLAFPNFKEVFYVTTDASDYAVGAVLSQGIIPYDRPIQYFSKTLGPAQINYATIHKELLSIIMAIEQFRHYLYGRPFVVITDHKPLTSLFKQSKLSSRLLRWKLILSEYDFKIMHLPGKQNHVADCLSRIRIPNDGENSENQIEMYDIQPKSIEELVTETDSAMVLQVMTRNKAREIEILNQVRDNETNGNRSNKPINKVNPYVITEDNNILIQQKNFDHIFYLFEGENCEMRRKLQDKLKKKFKIESPMLKFQLYAIDNVRSVIICPRIIRNTDQIEKTKFVLNQIYEMTEKHQYERIAVNIDMHDAASYFEFKKIFKDIFKGSNTNATFYLNRVIELNEVEDIRNVLDAYHKSLLGGHVGMERMKNNIRRFYSWSSLTADIKNYIKRCPICERSKVQRHTKMPMQITTTASEAFEKVYIDFVGPISPPSVDGHRYICTASCDLTKYAIAVATFNSTALTAAKTLVDNVFLKYNIPKAIVADNGPSFISELFKEITKLLKIKRILTTPYHPQSNAVERYHRTLGNYLKAFTESEPDNWHNYLNYATFSYNNTVNSVTNHSPHSLLFGFDIKIPTNVTQNKPSYNYDSYKSELQQQLRNTQKLAQESIAKQKERNKQQYDKKANPLKLQVNDLVLLYNENKTHKFDNSYIGPYRVEKIISPTVIIIRKDNKSVKTHIDKLIKAEADYGDETPPRI